MPLKDCSDEDIDLIGLAVGVPGHVAVGELRSSLHSLELTGLLTIEVHATRIVVSLPQQAGPAFTVVRRFTAQ